MVEMITKQDMLNKLRAFKETPDNDTIRFKKKIEKKLEDVAEREHFSDELEEPETPVRKEEKNIRKDSAKEEDDIEIIDLNDL